MNQSTEKVLVYLKTLSGPFNDMRTLKFKAQPTNAFIAAVSLMFGGSSQHPTSAVPR